MYQDKLEAKIQQNQQRSIHKFQPNSNLLDIQQNIPSKHFVFEEQKQNKKYPNLDLFFISYSSYQQFIPLSYEYMHSKSINNQNNQNNDNSKQMPANKNKIIERENQYIQNLQQNNIKNLQMKINHKQKFQIQPKRQQNVDDHLYQYCQQEKKKQLVFLQKLLKQDSESDQDKEQSSNSSISIIDSQDLNNSSLNSSNDSYQISSKYNKLLQKQFQKSIKGFKGLRKQIYTKKLPSSSEQQQKQSCQQSKKSYISKRRYKQQWQKQSQSDEQSEKSQQRQKGSEKQFQENSLQSTQKNIIHQRSSKSSLSYINNINSISNSESESQSERGASYLQQQSFGQSQLSSQNLSNASRSSVKSVSLQSQSSCQQFESSKSVPPYSQIKTIEDRKYIESLFQLGSIYVNSTSVQQNQQYSFIHQTKLNNYFSKIGSYQQQSIKQQSHIKQDKNKKQIQYKSQEVKVKHVKHVNKLQLFNNKQKTKSELNNDLAQLKIIKNKFREASQILKFVADKSYVKQIKKQQKQEQAKLRTKKLIQHQVNNEKIMLMQAFSQIIYKALSTISQSLKL